MISRFQVVATLQAARAIALGYPTDVAKSFGLNRAIFYAAAKKGFKGGKSSARAGEVKYYKKSPFEQVVARIKEEAVGNEVAYYIDYEGKKRFVMGNEILDPRDYKNQIESRFTKPYDKVWEEAVAYIQSFDQDILESQRKFYEVVYKPKRDDFIKQWSG